MLSRLTLHWQSSVDLYMGLREESSSKRGFKVRIPGLLHEGEQLLGERLRATSWEAMGKGALKVRAPLWLPFHHSVCDAVNWTKEFEGSVF